MSDSPGPPGRNGRTRRREPRISCVRVWWSRLRDARTPPPRFPHDRTCVRVWWSAAWGFARASGCADQRRGQPAPAWGCA